MQEPLAELIVACPSCGGDVEVSIEARTYPVNPLNVMRVGLGAVAAPHVCPPGPDAGERLAS